MSKREEMNSRQYVKRLLNDPEFRQAEFDRREQTRKTVAENVRQPQQGCSLNAVELEELLLN